MIRDRIYELFRQAGRPLELKDVASNLKISLEQLEHRIAGEPKRRALDGMPFEEAQQLIDFYGPEWFFSEQIVSNLAAYFAVNKKIKNHERKALKRKQRSSDDDSEPK